MPPRIKRAFLLLSLCYWLAVCAEMGAGTVYAVRQGWLAVPFATGPVSVMIVEDTDSRGKLTPGQLRIMDSMASGGLRDYLKTHGEKDPFRLVSHDASTSDADPKWQAAFSSKGSTFPWLVVTRGGHVLLSEPLPSDAEEAMRHVRRFGGQ